MSVEALEREASPEVVAEQEAAKKAEIQAEMEEIYRECPFTD